MSTVKSNESKGENNELWRAGAGELAKLIRTRKVSSREVVEAHLTRIAEVNPAINAVTVVLAEEALAAADRADAALAEGQPVGPLHGVPMTVKENIDVMGSATTQGIAAFANMLPHIDAPHIAQLKSAGAITIGRTNMPDFGFRWHTDNALRGATRNPWDSTHTPGGSSGGDAAALATGMTPLAMGNDYGGSLRVPSQACGTVALRPTLGRVASASAFQPRDYPMTLQMFAVQGPMARHISDLRLALEVMSGPDPRDPWWVPAALHKADPRRSLRVAVTIDPGGLGVDPDVAAGVRKAADALSNAGYEVEEVQPPAIAEGADLWAKLIFSEAKLSLLPILEQVGSADELRFFHNMLAVVKTLNYAEYVQAFATRNEIARAWSLFQADWSLVLGPVSTLQPPLVGFDLTGPDEAGRLFEAQRLVVLVNLLSLPSVAFPVAVANGLPQGVQIVGPRYGEMLCLSAAQVVEDQLGTLTPINPRGVPAENNARIGLQQPANETHAVRS
jgi:amidase